MTKPSILYVGAIAGNLSQNRKLAGIRRYCAARGWEAVSVPRASATPAEMPDILRRHGPVVGCVVDAVGMNVDLPPPVFGPVPVAYIGYPREVSGNRPNFRFDADAIAEMALRELSAGMPPCYAAIGFPSTRPWSAVRIRAFRAAVAATGARCLVFPSRRRSSRESWEDFSARLAPWLAKLPRHCAVFAVSDETAVAAVRAARLAKRHIPRTLTLVSVDNFTELCEGADPPVSSIELDFERMGFVAARSLGGAAGRGSGSATIGPLLTVRRKSTSGRGRHEKFVVEAVETIRREACEGLSARALAARFPVTRRLFDMRFHEATGHSVLDEILHVRLEKALTLLSQTGTAIGEIHRLCGFGCGRTLDALFRSRFHMSMREWRKRNAR